MSDAYPLRVHIRSRRDDALTLCGREALTLLVVERRVDTPGMCRVCAAKAPR